MEDKIYSDEISTRTSEGKLSEVKQYLKEQDTLLSELHTAISALGDKISPVLREKELEEEKESTPRENLVPVANLIRNGNDAISQASKRLTNLQERCEL